ncbi:MAG: PHP domain-containing protein, partial [Planctomycetes bacterium]|nr:PHP domain-containing protein [Planctomycetota bacterium]
MDFVHLHLHSDNSLLDGSCNISGLISRAKSLDMKALSLTDHGNMFGAIEFYQECLKNGIKPIVGIEAYVAPGNRKDRVKTSTEEPAYHLTMLVKNETGYRNLCKLSTLSYKEGFYYKPRMDKEILK